MEDKNEKQALLYTRERSESRGSVNPGSSAGTDGVGDECVKVLDDQLVQRVNSNAQTMMHLIKGNIGTGILAMGMAVSYAGLWAGTVGLVLIGVVAVHCMHLLVKCSHHLCHETGLPKLDYAQVSKHAFALGPRPFRGLRHIAAPVVNIFLFITQFGFCTIYILFTAQNIKQVIEEYTKWDIHIRLYQLFVMCLLIPITFIKTLRLLAPFSTIANFLTVVGLVIIVQYCVRDLPKSAEGFPAFNPINKWPLYFGIAIYAYEGIGVVLPIENAMKNPDDYRGLTGVMNTAMELVTILYITLGFYGYLRFGDAIQGTITLNLPTHEPLYVIVKIMFSLAIYISYAIQFYVPAIILETKLLKCLPPSGITRKIGPYLLRMFLVMLTFVISIVVPHLELMISLVGAFASSALALIIPPILEVVIFWNKEGELGVFKWRLVKNAFIFLFGVAGFIAGTIVTLIEIVQTFKNDKS